MPGSKAAQKGWLAGLLEGLISGEDEICAILTPGGGSPAQAGSPAPGQLTMVIQMALASARVYMAHIGWFQGMHLSYFDLPKNFLSFSSRPEAGSMGCLLCLASRQPVSSSHGVAFDCQQPQAWTVSVPGIAVMIVGHFLSGISCPVHGPKAWKPPSRTRSPHHH